MSIFYQCTVWYFWMFSFILLMLRYISGVIVNYYNFKTSYISIFLQWSRDNWIQFIFRSCTFYAFRKSRWTPSQQTCHIAIMGGRNTARILSSWCTGSRRWSWFSSTSIFRHVYVVIRRWPVLSFILLLTKENIVTIIIGTVASFVLQLFSPNWI